MRLLDTEFASQSRGALGSPEAHPTRRHAHVPGVQHLAVHQQHEARPQDRQSREEEGASALIMDVRAVPQAVVRRQVVLARTPGGRDFVE